MEPVVPVGEGGEAAHKLKNRVRGSLESPQVPGQLSNARAPRFGTLRTLGQGQGEQSMPSGLASRPAHNLARPEGIYLFFCKTCCRLSKTD